MLPADSFPALVPGDPTRTTVMLDWNPSEFSRWRLQYAWDDARDDGDDGPAVPAAIPVRHRRARRAQVLGGDAMKNLIRGALALLVLTLRAAGAGGSPRARDDGRLGRAHQGAGRRPGRRLHRDHGAAGRASRRGEAEPGRAGAHGGAPGRERRRARSRMAAGAAAGVRQSAHPARRAGLLRGDLRRDARRGARKTRPLHGRHPSARQSAHPARSAQCRRGREGAHQETLRSRSCRRRDLCGAGRRLCTALDRGDGPLGGQRCAAARTCRS